MFTETLDESLALRYGAGLDVQPGIEAFLRHRCVRKYSDKPVSEETIRGLVACAQSAATSSNLQLWSVVSVQDAAKRETMAQLCGNQQQIRDAAWYLCFLADHHRIRYAAGLNGEAAEGLDYNEFYTMAVIDAALAAERLVCAAESIGLGICYIGGLRNHPDRVAEELNLPTGVFGVFGLTIGWPDEQHPAEIKPRLSQEATWFRETYNPEPPIAEYDARMSEFYESQKMKGDVKWSMRSARRVGLTQLSGREVLKPWLNEHGMDVR